MERIGHRSRICPRFPVASRTLIVESRTLPTPQPLARWRVGGLALAAGAALALVVAGMAEAQARAPSSERLLGPGAGVGESGLRHPKSGEASGEERVWRSGVAAP